MKRLRAFFYKNFVTRRPRRERRFNALRQAATRELDLLAFNNRWFESLAPFDRWDQLPIFMHQQDQILMRLRNIHASVRSINRLRDKGSFGK